MNVVAEYLAAERERLGLERFGVPRRPECVLLTPRFRRSRHIVVLVLGAGGREPVLVAKLPLLAGDGAAVAREARNLRAARAAPAGTVPGLVAHRDGPGHPLLLQTALAGRPLGPAAVRRDRDGAVAVVAAWLERLAAATATFPPDDGWYERLVGAPLRTLAARGGPERAWARATLAAAEPLREAGLPLVAAHGDLGHPNLLLVPAAGSGCWTWSVPSRRAPGRDLVFFSPTPSPRRRGDQPRPRRPPAAAPSPVGARGPGRRSSATLTPWASTPARRRARRGLCARASRSKRASGARDAAGRHLDLWDLACAPGAPAHRPRSPHELLYVTAELPWPLTSGYLRHFHCLRGLSGATRSRTCR